MTERLINTSENEKQRTFIEFGELAKGTIEAGPDQQERLEEFTDRVGSGEFHKKITWRNKLKMLLARCVDGRSREDGQGELVPNAAGGSETIFVADDLTSKRFAAEDDSTLGGYKKTLAFLEENGFVVGGHTGEHAHDDASDCGANDKLQRIYQFIVDNHDSLYELTTQLGVPVSEKTHILITENAENRTQFSKGRELFDALEKKAEPAFLDRLKGDHKEVLAVLNYRKGTTLDRAAVAEEFGDTYQAFNVDVWAFRDAAEVISETKTEEDIEQKVAAMVYYNLATALVLSGGKMRLKTRDFDLAA